MSQLHSFVFVPDSHEVAWVLRLNLCKLILFWLDQTLSKSSLLSLEALCGKHSFLQVFLELFGDSFLGELSDGRVL